MSDAPANESTPASPASGSAPAQPALQRRLGLVSLTVYGVGNMLGAGIYGTIGSVAGELGNALWLSFVASMVAAGLTGLSYACLGSRYPRAAGAAYITRRAFDNSFLPYLIGLAVMCSGMTSMAAASHVFASYGLELFGWIPDPNDEAAMAAAAWVIRGIVLVFLVVIALINFRGIRESAWVNAVCTATEVGGLLFVIAIGIRFIGGVNYLDATTATNPTGGLDAALVLSGAVLTFFAFIGFEDLLNVSEEVKNPRRTLPLALISALGIATVIYILVSVVTVSVVNSAELAELKGRALYRVVDVGAPWFPPKMFALIAMFAVSNTALLNYIMGSRLAYGMARQGLLPAALGKVHPKRHTPHVAILAIFCIVGVLVMLGDITSLARATSILLLFSFTVVNIALIVLKRRPGEPKGGFEVPVFVPVLAALVCVAMIANTTWKMIAGAVNAKETADGIASILPLFFAAGLIAMITVLFFVLKPKVVADVEPAPEPG